jgi:hypothetical protein
LAPKIRRALPVYREREKRVCHDLAQGHALSASRCATSRRNDLILGMITSVRRVVPT